MVSSSSEGIVYNGRSEILDRNRVPIVQTARAQVKAKKELGDDQQQEASDQADTAHLDANLPSYRQAATEIANQELQSRLGEQIPITNKTGEVLGYKEVTPVDPMRRNEDLQPPQPPAASAQPGQ